MKVLLSAALCALVSAPLLSAQTVTGSGAGVGEFITSDGQFDLEKARTSGFQGALNTDGFSVGVDPATGAPSFQAVAKAADADPADAYWDTTACPQGVDNWVIALAVYDGKLIAGGNFSHVNGSSASGIAAWDGSSWSALGDGTGSGVYALTVWNNKLIAAGVLSACSGTAKRIAAWDGTSWSPLGSGSSRPIYSLAVYDGKLIAGIWDENDDMMMQNGLQAWDGTSWSVLGSKCFDGMVYSLAAYKGKLLASGNFYSPVDGIAAWDGTSWSSFSSLGGGCVESFAVSGDSLIAGGMFTSVGGVSANRVALWNGTAWSALGDGVNGTVYDVAIYNGKIIAGGTFTTAGGVSANRIAAWDGTSWSALGSGVDGELRALEVYDNTLFAGGGFGNAGAKPSSHFAHWTKYDAPVPAPTITLTAPDGGEAWAAGTTEDITWTNTGTIDSVRIELLGASGTAVDDTIAASAPNTGTYSWSIPSNLTAGSTYQVRIASLADASVADTSSADFSVAGMDGVDGTPTVFAVAAPYPNPFNPSMTLRFDIPQAGNVRVAMYNVLGQEIRVLHDGIMNAGTHSLVWDGRDDSGKIAASGAYFYAVKVGASIAKGKVMFMR